MLAGFNYTLCIFYQSNPFSGFFELIPSPVIFLKALGRLDLDDELDNKSGAKDKYDSNPTEDDIVLE